MPLKRFTVTHPDGTVSTRSSRTRIYTHAIAGYRTRSAKLVDLQAEHDRLVRHAHALRVAADTGRVTHRSRGLGFPTSDGRVDYVLTLTVPGFDPVTEWADEAMQTWLSVKGEWLPRDGVIETRNHARDYARTLTEEAERKAEAIKSAEADGWTVFRWSQSLANAQHGLASREVNWYAQHGWELVVVEVDA